MNARAGSGANRIWTGPGTAFTLAGDPSHSGVREVAVQLMTNTVAG